MKTFVIALASVWSILLPAACVVFWKKKTSAPIKPFIVGAVTFLVFAMGLEQLLHVFCLPLVMDKPLLYALYGALAAGVFEETGRFVAFSTVLKKNTAKNNSVAYGIGHGGIEVLLVLGINYITVLFVLITKNPVALNALQPAIEQLAPGVVLVAMLERLFALLFHICASVFVFISVHDKSKRWYFPLAILLHALLDLPAALYQKGQLSLWAVEAIVVVYTVLFAVITKKVYAGYREKAAEECTE